LDFFCRLISSTIAEAQFAHAVRILRLRPISSHYGFIHMQHDRRSLEPGAGWCRNTLRRSAGFKSELHWTTILYLAYTHDIRIRYIMEYFYIQLFQILRAKSCPFVPASEWRCCSQITADIRPAARIASSCMAVSTGPDAILTIAPPLGYAARRAWHGRYRVGLVRDRQG
jgi:hypothetical protein